MRLKENLSVGQFMLTAALLVAANVAKKIERKNRRIVAEQGPQLSLRTSIEQFWTRIGNRRKQTPVIVRIRQKFFVKKKMDFKAERIRTEVWVSTHLKLATGKGCVIRRAPSVHVAAACRRCP